MADADPQAPFLCSGMEPRERLGLSRRTKQIPTVTRHVEEDGDAPVRLAARRSDKADALVGHAAVRRLEVVHPQEKADPPGKLVADGSALPLAVCPS